MNTNHLSELWNASWLIGSVFAILFGISTSSLYLGFTNYNECPYEPFLPQGLVSFGLLSSICSITALILVVISFFQVDNSGTHLYYWLYACVVLAVYGISAILLASSVAHMFYTKHVEYQSENPNNSKSFCHKSIYNFCHSFAPAVIGSSLIVLLWLIRFWTNEIYQSFGKKSSTQ